MFSGKWFRAVAFGVLALGLSGGAMLLAEEAKDAPAKPYPLKTCVVSGDELGKMGEGKTITYEGREIRFCCKDCEPDFRKNPEKYIKKLIEAEQKAAATQPSTMPAHGHDGH
jgi:YHS domain-containing protein